MNETTERVDVYARVTNRIIEQLEQGTIPWEKPWIGAGLPQNIVNKTFYRGINILLLGCLGYERNAYLTWQQTKALGASVKRGEHGNLVVFWKVVEKEVEGQSEPKKMQFLRYHNVFNIEQCTNLPQKLLDAAIPPENLNDPITACEKIIKDMLQCPEIRHKESRAYYDPEGDYVNMPKLAKFKSSESYYGTLFHELIHSTGHSSRLNREGVTTRTGFGSQTYSFEELVAEIGACYLQSVAGVETVKEQQNRVAYLHSWLEVLRGDKKFIINASAHAQRAADFVLGHYTQKPAQ